MIGVSIVLSQRSLHTKKIRKRSILFKIFRRIAILFLLGKNKIIVCCSTLSSLHPSLTDDEGKRKLEDLEILDDLQRLALCYFFTAVIVLFLAGINDEPNTTRSATGKTETRIYIV
jgi:predicted acyltransferase